MREFDKRVGHRIFVRYFLPLIDKCQICSYISHGNSKVGLNL